MSAPVRGTQIVGLIAGCCALAGLAHADATTVAFTPAEVKRILAHGPWPPPPVRDPSNRVSANAEAIAFGERLFFDTRLSSNGLVSCAKCHQPGLRWIDGRDKAIGLAGVDRNTPTLDNVGGSRWFGWDGANDSLWAQSIRPILDPREMGESTTTFAAAIRRERDLACRYERNFGDASRHDDELVLVNSAKALAAYQETLVSGRTPFDDFRDALARNDAEAMARYPAGAQRGLEIFVGRGACDLCHSGPKFTNGEFHDIGIAFFAAPGRVDPGRYEGIRKLLASPYNLLGRYNDDASGASASSTKYVALVHRNFGEFKVPSLRNVALTAPYMLDGSLKTLEDAVKHYSDLDPDRLHADGERILKPLNLTKGESADLIAFLESLSDPQKPGRRTSTAPSACD